MSLIRALLLSVVLLPSVALAATEQTFDFRGHIPGRWPVQGWSNVSTQADGLHIATPTDGAMTTLLTESANAQVLELTTIAPKTTVALFLWHVHGTGPQMIQLPVQIAASTTPLTTTVDLTHYPQWDPNTDSIGLALQAGTQITIQSIALVHHSGIERLWTAVQSFGYFDTFGTSSINFLWGPLVAFSPEELSHLYQGQPPVSWSAMRFVYAFLLIAIIAWWFVRWNGRPRRARKILIATVITLWLLLDLHMSAEIVSYALNDIRTFVTQPIGQRMLRDHGTLYDVVTQNSAWLQQTPQFVVVSDLPIVGNVRYLTLPSLPIPSSSSDAIQQTHWFVFEDPTVSIDAEGHLTKKGVVLSSPGSIVKQVSTHTFFFLTK